MGSVKDLQVTKPPSPDTLGEGVFVFSDDYSVFDWGKMPDTIPGKGAALALMGAYNFELMEKNGIATHYQGMVQDEETVALKDLTEPSNAMAVRLTQVPPLPFRDGVYDYDAYYHAAGENYLLPLEIVFRNSVPAGSSVRERYTPRDLGVQADAWPEEAVALPAPFIDFSTKLEATDRYLSLKEAQQLSGLTPQGFQKLFDLANQVNALITEQAKKAGFVHEDGKIEVFFFKGRLVVCDVAGTFDENRFTYQGRPISKESIRQYYKTSQPSWVAALKAAKQEAALKSVKKWQLLCKEHPQRLPNRLRGLLGEMYMAGANAYTQRAWFDVRPLEDILKDLYR